jgi:hypothetical protein
MARYPQFIAEVVSELPSPASCFLESSRFGIFPQNLVRFRLQNEIFNKIENLQSTHGKYVFVCGAP